MPSNPAPKHNPGRGYAIALASQIILSLTAILIRHLTQTYGLPALVLAFWREAFVVVTLLAVLLFVRPSMVRVERRHLPYLIAYGLVLAGFNAIWTLSVSLNGAALATVLVFSSAAFTALLGRWLLKERLDWVKILAVILTLSGCLLASGALESATRTVNALSIITGVFSGLGYAAYSLMGRAASYRGFNPWTTVLYAFGFGTLFMLGFNLQPWIHLPGAATTPADLFWLGRSWVGWAILFVLAAGPTLSGYGLWNVALTCLPASVVNLVATVEPVFTAVIAYIFLHERLTGIQIVGSALILLGVLFFRIYDGWLEKQAKALAS